MASYVSVMRALLFLIILQYCHTQKSVCTFTPENSSDYTSMTLQGTALLNSAAVLGSSPSYSIDSSAINLMGMQIEKSAGAGPDIQIEFTVETFDTSTSPDQVNIVLTLTNLATSGGNLSSAYMEIDLGKYIEAYWDSGIPSGAVPYDRSKIEYNASNVGVGESQTIHFKAEPAGEGGIDLPEGQTKVYATLYFTYLGTTYGHILPSVCVERVTVLTESIVYQHGFTALTFFVTFLAAIGLTILGVWLFLYIRRRRRDATVSPSDERKMRAKGKNIVMDAKTAMRRGANCIKDFSLIAWDDSLIYILSLKDKLQMHREIDNLDILSTIHVDTDIEKEQNETSVQASLLLIQGLRHNGDINKSVEDKVNSSMQSRLKELDIKLEAEYRKDLEAVYMDIEAKNRKRLGDLLQRHKDQRQEVVRVARDLQEIEKKRFLDLIDHEQQTEENELTYKLALEQNTEAEKLRKEYAMQKRTGIKEIQQHFISDAVEMGSLNVEKSEWLMKQHKELQEEIHKKYDNEISLQRMVLEEKLTRRRALALKSESQEDDSTETLNNIASVQLTLLAKLRKVSEDQADEYINQIQSDLINVKDKMNEDKESKQLELAKKLSQAKQKALAEKMNQHASELNKFVSSNKALQSDGPVDPLSYVDGLVSLKSHQRIELCALENELDESHAHELESVRQQGVQKAKDELETLERALIEKVKTEGLSDHIVDKILADHKKMMNEMAERQLVRRQNQDARLKDELARRKREWENRRIIEKKEQQGLREHEGEVVDKLLSSQVALSEQERDRILREHEKQMVMFENSLTLNKLRQKQMLEEKISQRRARQREDLQQKQNAELLKQRKYAENNGEEDDEHTYKKEMLLLKKHAEQRITAMQAVDFDMEAQLEEVRVEMAKERALILKDKEERLGALIASLQMDKAREMARIEEQQKAINSLKANLMDDLNARGILSTPECEKILSIHKEEQEHLSHKLDGQRIKQEKMLHQKLQERLSQREKIMMQQQENEMRMLMNSAGNKTNANIRRAILLNKQMVQMEQFRNKMEKEISQSLANTKNNFEIQKQQIFQDQEMKFLAGLVKIGQLSRNELVDVLHMLFPGKTEESILEILSRIYPDETPLTRWEDKTKNPSDHKMERRQSTLADRIYTDQYSNPTPLHRRGSVMTMFPPKGSNTDKKLKKKGSQLQMTSNSNYSLGYDTTGPSENPQISPLTNYEQINGGSYNYLQTRNIPTQNSLRRQSRTSGLGNENFSKQRLEDNEYLLGKKKQLPPNDSAYKNYTERRFDHSGEGDKDSDDNGYRQYRRDSQLKYGTKTSTKLDERHKGPRRQGRINHNGEDEEEEENGSDEDYYTEKDETEQRYTSRRLPPLRNQSEPSAKKKKSKLLKKLAHHDDYDY